MFERWQYRRGLAAFLAAGLVGLAALAGADAAPRKQQKPCAESLDQCPDSGCAFNDEGKTPAQQQAEALLNRTKRHKVTGGPWVRLTFDDFEALQEVAASRVDNGRNSALSETDRAKLRDLPLPSGKAMAEGGRVD